MLVLALALKMRNHANDRSWLVAGATHIVGAKVAVLVLAHKDIQQHLPVVIQYYTDGKDHCNYYYQFPDV